MKPPDPSRLMWLLFLGFALSFGYCAGSAGLLFLLDDLPAAQRFFSLYVSDFNIFIVLGVITATALIVRSSQDIIPATIEDAFRKAELETTDYYKQKQAYYSLTRTVIFASEFIVLGFAIFAFCGFPLSGLAETLLILAGCAQWALASYVGRKLRYAAMMLHALLTIRVRRNLFKTRSLDIINTAVNVAATLTTIFVYLHVQSYYNGPFQYDSFMGTSAKVFLLLPAILAAPVLLMFNFFPRQMIRRIYDKSIDIEVRATRALLRRESMSQFEKRMRLLGLNKMYREELRYSFQLTLSDLPIGITILLMIVEPIINQ